MTRLDCSPALEPVTDTNPLFHGLSPPPTSDLGFHSANFSAEFSAYAYLRSTQNFSDLPANQAPAPINRSLDQGQEVDQFPTAQNNCDERQNFRQHDSEIGFAWALDRNVFSDADVPMPFSTSPVLECSSNASFSTPNFPFDVNPFQSSVIHTDYMSISPTSPQTFGNFASAHGRLFTGLLNQCSECSTKFPTKAALYLHTKESNHSPHSCLCGTRFSRLDVLDRHIHSYSFSTNYPCTYCKKYHGTGAFRRRDHLTQHLKGYHRMEMSLDSEASLLTGHTTPSSKKRDKIFSCPHESCLDNRNANINKVNDQNRAESTFQTQSQLTQHIRKIHDGSLFPCRETHCLRIGGKGFFRKRDLMKHMREHHPPSLIIPSRMA